MAKSGAASAASKSPSGTVEVRRDKPQPAPELPKKEVKRELQSGTVEVLRLHPQSEVA